MKISLIAKIYDRVSKLIMINFNKKFKNLFFKICYNFFGIFLYHLMFKYKKNVKNKLLFHTCNRSTTKKLFIIKKF